MLCTSNSTGGVDITNIKNKSIIISVLSNTTDVFANYLGNGYVLCVNNRLRIVSNANVSLQITCIVSRYIDL